MTASKTLGGPRPNRGASCPLRPEDILTEAEAEAVKAELANKEIEEMFADPLDDPKVAASWDLLRQLWGSPRKANESLTKEQYDQAVEDLVDGFIADHPDDEIDRDELRPAMRRALEDVLDEMETLQ